MLAIDTNILQYKELSRTERRKKRKTQKKWDTTRRRYSSKKQAFMILLLLLAGDVEMNPGPVTCINCNQSFNRQSRLNNHQAKATPTPCNQCDRTFCFEARLHQHRLTEHTGTGISNDSIHNNNNNNNNLDTPIYLDTGHTQTDEYRDKIDEHINVIRTQKTNGKDWKKTEQTDTTKLYVWRPESVAG